MNIASAITIFMVMAATGVAENAETAETQGPKSVAAVLSPSTFTLQVLKRDPFTSIDERETLKSEREGDILVSASVEGITASLFQVTTISIDQLSIAIVNRRAF